MLSFSYVIPPVVSLALALALTPVVRLAARRLGFVAKPKTDRWHKKPTAMMGGVAIWLSVVTTYLLLVPHSAHTWVIVSVSTFLFLVGLLDDLLHVKPYQKLIGQIIGAAAIVNYGMTLPWTRSISVNMVITIFWLIGITNAVNLLDNMDGLATGIAAIASSLSHAELHRQQSTARSHDHGCVRRVAVGISGLQLASRVDFHGRQRFDVHRLFPGQLSSDKSAGRAVAQSLAGTRGADSGSLYSNLRHDVCHDSAQALRSGCVARRARSHIASAGRVGNVRAPRCVAALLHLAAFSGLPRHLGPHAGLSSASRCWAGSRSC
jgi:hypothetical protein